MPFHTILRDAAVFFQVLQGNRPPRPFEAGMLGLSDEIWDLMERCWADEPRIRPSLETVLQVLDGIDV